MPSTSSFHWPCPRPLSLPGGSRPSEKARLKPAPTARLPRPRRVKELSTLLQQSEAERAQLERALNAQSASHDRQVDQLREQVRLVRSSATGSPEPGRIPLWPRPDLHSDADPDPNPDPDPNSRSRSRRQVRFVSSAPQRHVAELRRLEDMVAAAMCDLGEEARERVRLMAMHEEELRRAAIERDELQGAMSSAQAHTSALSSKLRQSLVEADAQREAHTSALVERDGVEAQVRESLREACAAEQAASERAQLAEAQLEEARAEIWQLTVDLREAILVNVKQAASQHPGPRVGSSGLTHGSSRAAS